MNSASKNPDQPPSPTGEPSEEDFRIVEYLTTPGDRMVLGLSSIEMDALRHILTAAREAERHRKDGDTYRSAMIAAGNEVARLWEALREVVEKAAYDHAAWKLSRIAQNALREERTE